MHAPTYISTEAYHQHLDQLEQIARTFDPADASDLRTRIIEVLGDMGVWPSYCRDRAPVTSLLIAA